MKRPQDRESRRNIKAWSDPSSSHFAFKLRNYDPETKQMRKRDAQDGGEDTVEKAVEGLAESILREDAEKRKEELVRCLPCTSNRLTFVQDLFNIQPKRANWDLKRDMTNRMAKLDRKTNEAIAGIFRKFNIGGHGCLLVTRT